MISVLGDLIVDIMLHIDRFPIIARDLKHLNYIEVGPGGATNVAITASRLGLHVGCIGEVGDDQYADLLVDGLSKERVDISKIVRTPDTRTPIACVIVDSAAEPAYVGYRGSLTIDSLQPDWRARIRESEALFADGWADHAAVEEIILQGLRAAIEADIPRFFDPGPGNHEFDNRWHKEAASLSSVVLLNVQEAQRLSGREGMREAAAAILEFGPEMVVIKRGQEGCYLRKKDAELEDPGFSVNPIDTTGAGDSFDAAVIYGCLAGLEVSQITSIANATGAAKALKRGTGHNMPLIEDIASVARDEGGDLSKWPPEFTEGS